MVQKLETTEPVAEADLDVNAQAVVQFSSAVYFTTEDEGELEVDVQRLGDCSGKASFSYSTQDASARAGKKYVATSGDLEFAPEETSKTISVKILQDNSFDATLEFGMHISNVRGAQAGMYLSSCRIKIIDDDKFPSNKYYDLMESGRHLEIPSFGLMFEFMRMLFKDDTVRSDTIKACIMDQVTGLYFFLTLYLQMYLVDVVLKPEGPEGGGHEGESEEGAEEAAGGMEEAKGRLLLQGIHVAAGYLGRMLGEEGGGEEEEEEVTGLLPTTLIIPGQRQQTAIVIGVIYVLPYILLHILAQWRCWLKLAGQSRKMLQANLMRKFFNYREEHRGTLKAGEITMIMVRDVREVVDFGFMKVLEILRIFGKLSLALIFILTESRTALLPLLVYPVVLGIFLSCRQAKMLEVSEERAQREDMLVQSIGEAVNNYRLINDFQIRPMVVDAYEKSISDLNWQEQITNSFLSNNKFAPRWLTIIFIGGFMAIASRDVSTVGGKMSLGAFLATINVFKEVGAEIEEIYNEVVEIQRSIGPLLKISKYMNAETDLKLRMRINRFRRQHGKAMREKARSEGLDRNPSVLEDFMNGGLCSPSGLASKEDAAGKFPADDVPIQVKELEFKFTGREVFKHPVSMEFDQGKMYAFVGPSREGKATLLKLLGQVLLPSDEKCLGSIFVPSHLRILHVSNEVSVLRTSLLDNILMNQPLDKAGGMDRIIRICRRLKFSEEMMAELVSDRQGGEVAEGEEEGDGMSWMKAFAQTDSSRLTLARVFVMNAEVAVMHKPSVNFNQTEADSIIDLMREHVDRRGIELPESSRKFRRPRTLFYTTSVNRGLEIADCVLKVSFKEGITPLKPASVKEALENDHVWL